MRVKCLEDPAAKYFSPKVTSRDRAVFEAGVAIGTLVHQFTGIPIKNVEDLKILEEAIRKSLLAQPFRESVDVKINVEFPQSTSPYDYVTLKSTHIDARIAVKYGKCRVVARLRYIPELNYTLGFIEDIEEAV